MSTDKPWLHPGFVAGSLGRSRVQRKPKVLPEGSEVPTKAVDDLPGGVSDLLASALPGSAVPEDAAEYSPSQIAGSDPDDSDSDRMLTSSLLAILLQDVLLGLRLCAVPQSLCPAIQSVGQAATAQLVHLPLHSLPCTQKL